MPPPDKNHTDADLSDLRAAMRRWATGVSIVSTKLDESIHGMTVNSFTSISIDPALITVALEKTTRTHEMIMQSRIFGVTILTGEQQDISDRFAGRLPDDHDRFAGLPTEVLVTGAPFILGGLAYIDCRLNTMMDGGSNNLIVGEVVATKTAGEIEGADPLLYFAREYHRLK